MDVTKERSCQDIGAVETLFCKHHEFSRDSINHHVSRRLARIDRHVLIWASLGGHPSFFLIIQEIWDNFVQSFRCL
jgi:hypothetical protein